MIWCFWRSECTACLQTQALGLAHSGCAVAQQQVLDSHTSASSLLPYRLIRIPEKYQEASIPVCFTESSLSKEPWWCSSSGRVWREQSPGHHGAGSPRTQLWVWDAASPSCPAFGNPLSPTSSHLLVCWGVWRLDSKSFRVGACNVPQTNCGKPYFPVAGHQIVSLWLKHSQSIWSWFHVGFFDATEFGNLVLILQQRHIQYFL